MNCVALNSPREQSPLLPKKRKRDETPILVDSQETTASAGPETTILLIRLIGTDAQGSTYVPQRSLFCCSRDNSTHQSLILDRIQDRQQLSGFVNSKVFSCDVPLSFAHITAIGGLTSGFIRPRSTRAPRAPAQEESVEEPYVAPAAQQWQTRSHSTQASKRRSVD